MPENTSAGGLMDLNFNNIGSTISSFISPLTSPISKTSYSTDFLGGRPLTDLGTEDFNKWSKLNLIDNMNQGPSLLDLGTTMMNYVNMFKSWGMQDDYMDLAKEQLGMARDQWQMTKDEVNRIKKVRSNINQGYGGYGGA